MKINRPLFLVGYVLLSLLAPGRISAQKLVFLFAHGLYAMPSDSYFKHNFNNGYGVEGGAGIGLGSTFFIGTIGYSSFGSTSQSSLGNTSYTPIKGGLRQYILVGKIIFLQVDAGVAHVKNEVVNGSRFSGDLGLGVKLGPFEVMASYDGFARSDGEPSGYSSWIGIKAGARLGL
ncbi:MAG TPA: hypothetical protein VMI35_05455 [Puia sp.]|nr:hypothetical protein [Puia sp.]